MSNDILRVGLVGAGGISGAHRAAHASHPDAEVVAIADPRGEAVFDQQQAEYVPGTASDERRVPVYPDMAALLGEQEVDVIDICAPTPLHRDPCVDALGAGKHVLCEKPMGRNVEDCKAVLEASERSPGVFMVAHCLRFSPEYEYLKEVVESDRYGPIRRGAFERYCVLPPGSHFFEDPATGGAILDMHIHDVDAVLWTLGRPEAISAIGRKSEKTGCHEFVSACWEYGDAVIQLEADWPRAAPMGFRAQFWVEFEQATLVMDTANEEALVAHFPDGRKEAVELTGEDMYAREIHYFIDCARTGARPERCLPESSMAPIELIEREIEAIEAGSRMRLD